MPASASASKSPQRAGTFHLIFLTYSVICSGAYGLEEMVPASGPGLSVLMMVLLPIVWSIPLCLACAELAARYPMEGGYYRWARLAFGDFVGYQAGWLVALANLATNAAFAVLFGNYLRWFYPDLGARGGFIAALAVVWGTTFLNILGIRLVGTTAVILTGVIFLPFLFMAVGGLMQWQYDPTIPFIPPDATLGSALGSGLMIALWLYSGYEKLTPNAGEIENPSRAFPIALACALPMVIGSYLVPAVVGLAACDDWSHWGQAHFAVLSEQIGGRWLGALMSFGGLVSNACILMVTTLGSSRLPMVMAEDRLFPAAFGKTGRRYGTPVLSLLTGGVLLSLLCGVSFVTLAGFFSMVQVLAYVLIYASLWRLRNHAGAATAGTAAEDRPFRIPLGRAGLMLMMAPGVLIALWVVAQRFWNGGVLDLKVIVLDLAVLASGPATFFVFRRPGAASRPSA